MARTVHRVKRQELLTTLMAPRAAETAAEAKPEGVCTFGRCTSVAMRRGARVKAWGENAPAGMCDVHTFRAMVHLRGHEAKKVDLEFKDAAPYRAWLQEVIASGCVRYKNAQLTELKILDISDLTGLTTSLIHRVVSGRASWLRPPSWAKLAPFVAYVDTSPARGAIEVGQWLTSVEDMRYWPPGLGVVDSYGRLWQLRKGRLAPAHHPTAKPPAQVMGARPPLQVVYVPPIVTDKNSY